jgi:hypothetical protein
MEYKLENLNLIAQGGEADIYDLDETRVLRVLRRGNANNSTEKELLPILINHKIKVPRIYDYILIGESQAEIMEKIDGKTMIDYLQKHPLEMKTIVREFAQMHVNLLNIKDTCKITTMEDRINYTLKNNDVFDKKIVDFILEIYQGLTKGSSICHSDFHPGNILMKLQNTCEHKNRFSNYENYIIDWSGAYIGSYLSDIAHTYLLLTNVPVIPGQSRINHYILSKCGKFMAKSYLKEINKHLKLDYTEFSKWTVIMSMSRAFYGLPSEREYRINYVKRCYKLYNQNVNPIEWI